MDYKTFLAALDAAVKKGDTMAVLALFTQENWDLVKGVRALKIRTKQYQDYMDKQAGLDKDGERISMLFETFKKLGYASGNSR